MRFLVLYARSRGMPVAFAAAAGAVAALGVLDQLTKGAPPSMLGLLAVVAGSAVAGRGLAGADVDVERTAAIAWPPRRAVHVIAAGATISALVAATPLASTTQVVRDATGMAGLVALGAATLGARRAWILALTWTALGWLLRVVLWPEPEPERLAAYQQVLTWMHQPDNSAPAVGTAVVLGAAGLLAYSILGPRR